MYVHTWTYKDTYRMQISCAMSEDLCKQVKSLLQPAQLSFVRWWLPPWHLGWEALCSTACADVIPGHGVYCDSEQPETAPRHHLMVVMVLLPDKNQLMPPNPSVFVAGLRTAPASSPPCCKQWGADPILPLAPPAPIYSHRETCQVQKAQKELHVQRQGMTSMNSDRACLLAGEHSGEQ